MEYRTRFTCIAIVTHGCGPAAFVVLKAYAPSKRGFPEDAFDLFYMIRNYGEAGPEDVAARWHMVKDLDCATSALAILRDDFFSEASMGPKRVAEFLEQPEDSDLAADVVGFIGRFVELVSAKNWPPSVGLLRHSTPPACVVIQ